MTITTSALMKRNGLGAIRGIWNRQCGGILKIDINNDYLLQQQQQQQKRKYFRNAVPSSSSSRTMTGTVQQAKLQHPASCLSTRSFSTSTDKDKNNDDDNNNENENDEAYKSLRFVSHLKNPIVHQLWMARGKAKVEAASAPTVSRTRVPNDSKVHISYPFASDEFLRETYRNPWGQMRFGKILEDLDALAGNIAFAHVQDPTITIVTASVDRIRLNRPPPDIDPPTDAGTNKNDADNANTSENADKTTNCLDQHLSGKVTFVGTSSMEIRMQCTSGTGVDGSGEHEDEEDPWMEAYFTFVATDPHTGRPVRIPPLEPETELEHEHFQAGKDRALIKKQKRQQAKSGEKETTEDGRKIEQVAMQLMNEAGPLLNMPSLANPYTILIKQTELQTSEIAQPQVRNLANQIFGGFLMRRACELAYSTAYIFSGQRPVFYEVDQISFGIPVSVGDLLNFHARVLYVHSTSSSSSSSSSSSTTTATTTPLVAVEVEAWIIDPLNASAKLSNEFYFTFAVPSGTILRKVLPENMDQARTMAIRMAADEQEELEKIKN